MDIEFQSREIASGKKWVLVVDDELDQRNLMQDILEIFGFPVRVAQHGREAIEQLQLHPLPSLIFLDITMPVMGGREFLQEIYSGAHPALEKIPIIVVSAVAHYIDLSARYDSVVALVSKPMQIENLRAFAERFAR